MISVAYGSDTRMAWEGIEGHDAIAADFARIVDSGRLGGAYLFVGLGGVGKGTFAQKLAKSLLCSAVESGLVSCGRCASCIQCDAQTHPDYEVVQKPVDRTTIPLETFIGDAEHRMKEGLLRRIWRKPALGGRRIAVILDADAMSDEAANCLLKTLEEPPDHAVVILVGSSLERLLPTIRSRCQIIRFGSLDVETITKVLLSSEEAPDELSAAAGARMAGGSLERARQLLDPAFAEFREHVHGLLSERPLRGVTISRDVTALVEAAGKESQPRRARLRMAFEFVIEFYREALRMSVTEMPIADATLRAGLERWSGESEETSLLLGITLDALESIDRNANLTVLIDAWTALLERPKLSQHA